VLLKINLFRDVKLHRLVVIEPA